MEIKMNEMPENVVRLNQFEIIGNRNKFNFQRNVTVLLIVH